MVKCEFNIKKGKDDFCCDVSTHFTQIIPSLHIPTNPLESGRKVVNFIPHHNNNITVARWVECKNLRAILFV